MEIRMVSKNEQERISTALQNSSCCCEAVTCVGNTYYIGIAPERLSETVRTRLEDALQTTSIVINGVIAPAR